MMPPAKILTPINLGRLQLLHRAVIVALPGFHGGPGARNATQQVARGGLIVQSFDPSLEFFRNSPGQSAAPDRAWRAINRAIHAKNGFSVAQLACSQATAAAGEYEACLISLRDTAMRAQAMRFDGVELLGVDAPHSPVLLEAVQILIDVWGADRVSVQLAPFAWMSAPDDARALEPFGALLAGLSDMDVSYIHLTGAV